MNETKMIAAALDAALGLLTLGIRATQAAAQIHAVIGKARAEGRDLTSEELLTAKTQREAAETEWQSLA